MKKHTYKLKRTKNDMVFVRIAIGLGIAVWVLVIAMWITGIELTKEESITPETKELIIDTTSSKSKMIGATVQAHEPEPVSSVPVGPVEVEVIEPEIVHPYIELTDDEKYTLATLIFLEGGGESEECQAAIGSVVLNRMTTSESDLESVIYADGQFEPAYLISSTVPTSTQIEIVNELCTNGPTLPEYITYFRANYYHDWGDLTPYRCIDNTYFSFSGDLCYQVMSEAMTEEE